MSTFIYTELSNDRALVTDGGKRETVLNVFDWNQAKLQLQHKEAVNEYDDTVAEFFAAITDAAEKLEESLLPVQDPNAYITIVEGEAGTPHVCGQVMHLDYDSQIARLIAEGQTDRLVWVGKDRIEILKYEG